MLPHPVFLGSRIAQREVWPESPLGGCNEHGLPVQPAQGAPGPAFAPSSLYGIVKLTHLDFVVVF